MKFKIKTGQKKQAIKAWGFEVDPWGAGRDALKAVTSLGEPLLYGSLLLPPLAGFTIAHAVTGAKEPSEADWELMRKKELIELYNMHADLAEQKARERLGAED